MSASLAFIEHCTQELADAEKQAAEYEALHTHWKERARLLRDVDIPEYMRQLGLNTTTFADGTQLDIKESAKFSIDTVDRDQAIAWLLANDMAGCLRHIVAVKFGVNDRERAERLLRATAEAFPKFDYRATLAALLERVPEDAQVAYVMLMQSLGLLSDSDAVATEYEVVPATFRAALLRRLRTGQAVPLHLFGHYVARSAVLLRPSLPAPDVKTGADAVESAP